ncbi:MAG TPA: cupredoxin domain-containing protein [Terriglobales bacterium]|nr:cupredoxin domain-containing protein [Terriglobales bacterium]
MVLIALMNSGLAAAEARKIEITAKRFEYSPAEITIKRGETVTLVVRSLDVAHGLKFKELEAQTEIPKGRTAELTLTPTQAGTFVGQCSHFCGSGHGQMKLTLHVTD